MYNVMSALGFGPVVWVLTFILALGIYKFVKDWLPW
uniref:Uncharacterized protein n=1 Tax=Dulem virus 75 TaxID=3145786 RepID=A0AAU8AUI7_9VIRU